MFNNNLSYMPPKYNTLLCRNILGKNVFIKLCSLVVTIGLTFVTSSKARSQVLDGWTR